MVLTVDKDGRILIPKRLRQKLHLRPGSRLKIGVQNEKKFDLEVQDDDEQHRIARMPSGFPYLDVGEPKIDSMDTVELIRQDRIAYLTRKLGL